MAKDGVTLAINAASTAGLAYTVGVVVGRGSVSTLVFLLLLLTAAAVANSWHRFIKSRAADGTDCAARVMPKDKVQRTYLEEKARWADLSQRLK